MAFVWLLPQALRANRGVREASPASPGRRGEATSLRVYHQWGAGSGSSMEGGPWEASPGSPGQRGKGQHLDTREMSHPETRESSHPDTREASPGSPGQKGEATPLQVYQYPPCSRCGREIGREGARRSCGSYGTVVVQGAEGAAAVVVPAHNTREAHPETGEPDPRADEGQHPDTREISHLNTRERSHPDTRERSHPDTRERSHPDTRESSHPEAARRLELFQAAPATAEAGRSGPVSSAERHQSGKGTAGDRLATAEAGRSGPVSSVAPTVHCRPVGRGTAGDQLAMTGRQAGVGAGRGCETHALRGETDATGGGGPGDESDAGSGCETHALGCETHTLGCETHTFGGETDATGGETDATDATHKPELQQTESDATASERDG
eukprot:1175481-Prorocentrum_minimum.AAC.1